jgi:hypothetical protein
LNNLEKNTPAATFNQLGKHHRYLASQAAKNDKNQFLPVTNDLPEKTFSGISITA